MKKYVCTVCGYIAEGEIPAQCPRALPHEPWPGTCQPRCTRPQSLREGYPEIAEAYKRYAYEEADHASRFAELLGEVVTDSTKKNLMMRAEAECGACAGKMDLAKKAKALNLDAIHDTVHEMAKDEARHGRGFEGLLKRYFNTEV